MDVETNLAKIHHNIKQACDKSNRNMEEITIIGVTKYVTIERTKEVIESGVTNIGENRLEGFLEKYNHLQNEATWHFIGTLQSRKVRDVINKIDVLHSLDRLSLAKEIEKRAEKIIDCFIQVNVSGEESKHGIHPDELHQFIMDLEQCKKINIVGLMTMAPHIDNENDLRKVFSELRVLRDEIQSKKLPYAPCTFLSMGMSNDYHIAIQEGATHIRIGTKLVGTDN